jgi:hypothetical protein
MFRSAAKTPGSPHTDIPPSSNKNQMFGYFDKHYYQQSDFYAR